MITTAYASVHAENGSIISTHCHNDLGLAVANSTGRHAGRRATGGMHDQWYRRTRRQCRAGRDRDGTECSRGRLPYDTAIVSEQLYPTQPAAHRNDGVSVQANKAIVGRNAFAHEAGIHQDGVIKNPLTYEIMTPHSVGCRRINWYWASIPGEPRWASDVRNSGIRLSGASWT